MKRERKRRSSKRNLNQLSFDFTQNIPIELHTPKKISVNLKKKLTGIKKLLFNSFKVELIQPELFFILINSSNISYPVYSKAKN